MRLKQIFSHYKEAVAFIGWLLLLFATLATLAGCKTQYIPVEKTVTEVRYRDLVRYDSIYQRDSIYLETKGDTVIVTKERLDFRVLFVNRTDTVFKNRNVEVEKEVEKPLKWYEQGFVWIGKLCCIAALLWALFLYLKKKK